ncbi:TerC family protein [Paenibacillus albiflavus]|uniref:TerC family protein n=1 Tax=Paenibacillus albiflavus TaxID=2545760 RepID=A0A4R4ECV5_9BACL|nr:TerC family protein [Paenibacillus albiflavus]TCZ77784.1 TerC family protein [Paenibacillus albiflavus]
MELFSLAFLTSLLSIVIIDLVLAGDNAIVIGLAARNLPKKDQKKVIILGTIGAVIIRVLATVFVVSLLNIPGLHLIGGLVLVWIAIKLVMEEHEDHNIKAGSSIWAAVRTIIIADAAMGLDNVLAVAGAAQGHILLVILGLMISIPVVVWGSTLVVKLMDRFPWVIVIGSAILGWTAAKMIVGEGFLAPYMTSPIIKYGFEIIMIAIIVVIAVSKRKKMNQANTGTTVAAHDHH